MTDQSTESSHNIEIKLTVRNPETLTIDLRGLSDRLKSVFETELARVAQSLRLEEITINTPD